MITAYPINFISDSGGGGGVAFDFITPTEVALGYNLGKSYNDIAESLQNGIQPVLYIPSTLAENSFWVEGYYHLKEITFISEDNFAQALFGSFDAYHFSAENKTDPLMFLR